MDPTLPSPLPCYGPLTANMIALQAAAVKTLEGKAREAARELTNEKVHTHQRGRGSLL